MGSIFVPRNRHLARPHEKFVAVGTPKYMDMLSLEKTRSPCIQDIRRLQFPKTCRAAASSKERRGVWEP